MKHTIQIHLDNDQIYFAFLRKKSEYGAHTWSEMVYKICNMPVLSPEDQKKCEILYEVMGKSKKYLGGEASRDLQAQCQRKLHGMMDVAATSNNVKPTLDELISKRDELLEFVNSDIDEKHRKRGLEMLGFFNQIIEEERKREGAQVSSARTSP
jgi:hypothetical protein